MLIVPRPIFVIIIFVFRIKTEPGNNITLKWKGFVLDGRHEGNKMRHGQKFFDCHRKK